MSRHNVHGFTFTETDEAVVMNKLMKINIRKSTGCDQLPPEMIRLGAKYLANPIKYLINMSISTSTFPNDIKARKFPPFIRKTTG